MKRLFGMMPASEIEDRKYFDDGDGRHIYVDAGPHGWTVNMADNSSMYRDTNASTKENMDTAIKCMKEYFPNAFEINELKNVIELKNMT